MSDEFWQTFASVWDALEDTPEAAANMRLSQRNSAESRLVQALLYDLKAEGVAALTRCAALAG